MKKITLSFLFLLAVVSAVAIPARRGSWQKIKLVDGTEVRAHLVGDETLHYMQAADGRQYVWNGQAYAPADMPALRAKAGVRKARAQQARSKRLNARRRVGGAGKVYSGKKKGLVIMVQFPAGTGSGWGSSRVNAVSFRSGHTKALYERILNEEGFTHADGINGSVKDYFKEQSNGQFELDFDVYGPVTLSHDYTYYGTDNGGEGQDVDPEDMVVEAVKAIQSGVDFSPYDWDGDGEVDQVYILYAGLGQANGGDANTIWPHEWQLNYDDPRYAEYSKNLTVNNGTISINTYACGPELQPERDEDDEFTGRYLLDGIGTFCHEFSHCLGLPDMYDTSYAADGMYCWDLMDYGSYLNNGYTPCGYTSYEKMFAGWLTPTELTTEDVSVSGMKALSEGGPAYIIYNDSHKEEFYMLENRQNKGFDSALPGTGLLVVHVDYDAAVWEANEVNNTASRQRCTVIPADGSTEYLTTATYQGETYQAYDFTKMAGDPYPYLQNDSLTNNSTPAATVYNRNGTSQYMNKGIFDIARHDDGTVSFNYRAVNKSIGGNDNVNYQYPAGTVLFHETFDKCNGKGGNNTNPRTGDQWSGNVATASFRPDNDDDDNPWLTYYNNSNGKPMAWGGYKCARFGSGTMPGDFQTPFFSFRGNAMLTFRAAPWGNDGTSLIVYCSQGNPSQAEFEASVVGTFGLTKEEWTEHSVIITGKGEQMFLYFQPDLRLFVDDIKVYVPETTGIKAIDNLQLTINRDKAVYDLQGRKVADDYEACIKNNALPKGIYIVSGKKIMK